MNALVLYDSKFGNTARIAEAITLALQETVPTRLSAIEEIGDCDEALSGVDILVVGGPTQRRGISDPLRGPLSCLGDRALAGTRVAVFDTRLRGSRLVTGSAAARLATLMRRHGAWVVVPPESFIVDGREGPLHEGEAGHARLWAHAVLEAVGVRPRGPEREPVGG